MNKNAYELRFDILAMAHGDMTNQYHEELNQARETIYHNGEDVKDFSGINVPLPSVEDIIDRANKLYEFVQNG